MFLTLCCTTNIISCVNKYPRLECAEPKNIPTRLIRFKLIELLTKLQAEKNLLLKLRKCVQMLQRGSSKTHKLVVLGRELWSLFY